jgi:hypothetical protein
VAATQQAAAVQARQVDPAAVIVEQVIRADIHQVKAITLQPVRQVLAAVAAVRQRQEFRCLLRQVPQVEQVQVLA